MQEYKKINDRVSFAGVIDATDLEYARELGIRTIINNLPDGEVTNGFDSKTAQKKAEELGLNYVFLPVTGATLGDQENINQLRSLLDYYAGPVLIHCKSGIRSAILWGLVASQSHNPAEIIAGLEKIGFEVDYLEDEFEEQHELALEKAGGLGSAKPSPSLELHS